MNPTALQYANLAHGALAEQVDAKIKEILANIEDVNTPAKDKRELTIKLIFAPNEDRDRCALKMAVAVKMPGFKPIDSDCFITRINKTLVAVEREDPRQGLLFSDSAADAGESPPSPTPNLTVVGGQK